MRKLEGLVPSEVFRYFEELTKIPRGSGDMERVSEYCMEFAEKHSLKALRDEANNVIIYKDGQKGYENSKPVILQGHLDMVCQKEENCEIDFLNDGLEIYIDGDFIKANGTTLGADNGIAVAIILSILADKEISHPPIEAVFTTDEEIGMIGALALSPDALKGKRMINIDSEDASVVTVSCAGGSDFTMNIPLIRKEVEGKCYSLSLRGLKGGHSGVEINSGRVNAVMLMARVLNHLADKFSFSIVSIDGGEKGNAIPESCMAKIVSGDDNITDEFTKYTDDIKKEISERESGFIAESKEESGEKALAISSPSEDKIIFALLCAPNGVVEMSAEIENLVETSLNLGILKTNEDKMNIHFALRSNKKTALLFLEDKLFTFSKCIECETETGGHYPPWEYNDKSHLKQLYKNAFLEKFGFSPRVEAIHAGLECGVFASQIENFDCISIGPEMHDIHTTKERLSISSTKDIYELILKVLEQCK